VSDLNHRTESETLSDDRAPFPELDALADESMPARGQRPPIREGLPASYRMRADAHYVDQLSARMPTAREQQVDVRSIDAPALADAASLTQLTSSIREHGVLQPLLVRRVEGRYRLIDGARRLHASIAAGLLQVPCLLHDVGDEEAAALAQAANARPPAPAPPSALSPANWTGDAGAELARILASLSACARMLSPSVSSFSRDAASTIIRAETGRASSLVQATRTLGGDLPHARGRIAVRRILDSAVQEVEAERLLHNVSLDADVRLANEPCVVGDEQQLVFAVAGALRATFSLLEGAGTPRVTLGVSAESQARVSLAVWQNAVAPVGEWIARAFDATWISRPGGLVALTAMLALKRVAEAHEGRASVEATGRGTRITLELPLAG
jgi:ParB-like chromosome segregation protein Spo0J